MNKKILLFFMLVLVMGVVLSGCIDKNNNVKYNSFIKEDGSQEKIAIEKCISLCKIARKEGIDLNRGPCLSEQPKIGEMWNIKNWVCDVAHHPREDIDNIPTNQCQVYRVGKAKHFVEVDPTCKFIRAI